jgi:hypothetical protein
VLGIAISGVSFAEFDIVLCPAMPTPAFPHDQSPDKRGRRIIIDRAPNDYPINLYGQEPQPRRAFPRPWSRSAGPTKGCRSAHS